MKTAALLSLLAFAVAVPSAATGSNLGHPTLLRCTGSEALLASYYDLFNNLWLSRRVGEVTRYVDPQFSIPNLPPGMKSGPGLLVGFVTMIKDTFPRRHLFNDVVLCKGNIVSARQTVVAFNDGPYLGKPPSGKVTVVTWTDTYRFRNGRIYETFAADGDTVDTSRQIGWLLVPPGEARPVTEPIPWVDRYPE